MKVLKFVNVYEVHRCYGGPEEGGWHYNAGEFLQCHWGYSVLATLRVMSSAQARAKAVAHYTKTHNSQYHMGHGPHDGCDPNGPPDDQYLLRGGAWGYGELSVYVESKPGKHFPTHTPHYQ